MTFQVIPVIDLMGGVAVAARGGRRDGYVPVRSALCHGSAPLDVARALVELTGTNILYIADLDGITGKAAQSAALYGLADALANVSFLLDGGFRSLDGAQEWREADSIVPVFGSESLNEPSQLASWPGPSRPSTALARTVKTWMLGTNAGHDANGSGDSASLSLDFDAEGFRGPRELLESPDLWPETVIVMSLDRVGENRGPDIDRLEELIVRAGNRRVIAAGGVRDMADVEAIADMGAAGVLIASALHDKRIGRKEIAAFQERRRFL